MSSDTDPTSDPGPGVDPIDLETVLRVLDSLHELPPDHPDIQTIKRATGRMYKKIRKTRRAEAKRPLVEADQKVLDATATGSPMRIDDETRGIPLASTTPGTIVGELNIPRGCYICHADYTLVDAFYHWLCPDCAAMSHTRRDQGTDLRGRRALLTGGRAKIGMYIALMLLRVPVGMAMAQRRQRGIRHQHRAEHHLWQHQPHQQAGGAHAQERR